MINKNFKFGAVIMLFIASPLVLAQTSNLGDETEAKVSRSYAEYKQALSDNGAKSTAEIKQVEATKRTLKYQGMTRDTVKNSREKAASAAMLVKNKQANITNKTNFHHSFSIYNAYSELLTDIDADGYYQTFSVSFDADILSPNVNEQAIVYADLYLSRNGGPWLLYFSTDNFVINGESTEDEFEVITNLESGYVPDNYDVLIDLYEVGYSDVVATYSSDDTNALYALPLESSDYDPEYIEVEQFHEHGGSLGLVGLSLLLLSVSRRK